MKHATIAAALWLLATPVSAMYYCVPFTDGVEYQKENGWTEGVTYNHGSHTVTIWYDRMDMSSTMLTLKWENAYDMLTGRHYDMMCQVRGE